MDTVPQELLDAILSRTVAGETVLELGSGESTQRLIDYGRKVITVEHDPEWLYKTQAVYLHAPIKLYGDKYLPLTSIKKRINTHTGWYDPLVLAPLLRDQLYSLILVDGPPRNFGRSGFLHHLDIFPNLECPIIFDDLDRIDDLFVAARVAAKLRRDLLVCNAHEYKPFGIV